MADFIPMSAPSRRDFLLSTGVFAAGALMTAPASGQQSPSQQPPATQPQRRDEEAEEEGITPQRDRPVIDPGVIAAAEQLAGITFTHHEREVMSRTIAEQVQMLASRQTLPRFGNELAPAMKFDPRLPGMNFDIPKKASVWSNRDAGALPGSDEDIAFAPVTQLSRWIESGKLTPSRLTNIYLDRLKRFDPQLKCVITLCEDHALKQAAEADREIAAGNYRGPLHGIPWGAKDLLDTADIHTTWGAEPWEGRIPATDATVVQKLNEAGAVLVAKLSLGALAYNDIWFGGRTNNPWDVRQGSSGSSAGSAAATAAGLVGFSIGTETYGSITSPCIRCGTTGLRPTFGRVGRAGAMALCWSLDKIGPICRTVEDCALVLDAINGYDQADPSSIALPLRFDMQRPLNTIRVGFSPKWFEQGSANELDREALDALRKTGVQMQEVEVPDWPYDVLLTILYCEAAAAFEDLTRSNLDDTLRWQAPQAWPNTFRQSWFLPGIELVQADRFRRQCMQMMAGAFEKVDVLFAPSFAASLCLITNNTGHPSLTVRCGFRTPRQRDRQDDNRREPPARVPHAISFIGRLFDEGTMCRVGLALERELNVWQERPPLV